MNKKIICEHEAYNYYCNNSTLYNVGKVDHNLWRVYFVGRLFINASSTMGR